MLVPISIVVGLVLVSQGVLQNLSGDLDLPRSPAATRRSRSGRSASQEAIKELGTNGGGFFNVNSAMPFENPTWISNFVEMLAILLVPAGLTATYGRMVGNRRQGWAIYAAMIVVFLVAVGVAYAAETHATPAMRRPASTASTWRARSSASGSPRRALWVAVTTAASCGAVNGAHGVAHRIGGAIPMADMQVGEVVFGGVGSGLYGMLLFVILAVFISGLMVGRTPEFLGKKIEAREVKLTVIATIGVPMLVLAATGAGDDQVGQGVDLQLRARRASPRRSTPTRRRRNNNGSAFAGYTGFVQRRRASSASRSPTCSAAWR